MRGRTQKITKPAKLRRPIEVGDVHGNTSSNPVPKTGTGNAGEGTDLTPASAGRTDPLADLYPMGPGRTYYRTEQDQIDIMEEVEATLSSPKADEPMLRAKLRGQLIQQAGGPQYITPSLQAHIESIVQHRIMKLKITRELERRGYIRVNNKTGTMVAQPIIKDHLLPIINSERLSLKAFSEEVERNRQSGRRGTGAEDWPIPGFESHGDDMLGVVNELNLLTGRPLVDKLTPEYALAEIERMKGKD